MKWKLTGRSRRSCGVVPSVPIRDQEADRALQAGMMWFGISWSSRIRRGQRPVFSARRRTNGRGDEASEIADVQITCAAGSSPSSTSKLRQCDRQRLWWSVQERFARRQRPSGLFASKSSPLEPQLRVRALAIAGRSERYSIDLPLRASRAGVGLRKRLLPSLYGRQRRILQQDTRVQSRGRSARTFDPPCGRREKTPHPFLRNAFS